MMLSYEVLESSLQGYLGRLIRDTYTEIRTVYCNRGRDTRGAEIRIGKSYHGNMQQQLLVFVIITLNNNIGIAFIVRYLP